MDGGVMCGVMEVRKMNNIKKNKKEYGKMPKVPSAAKVVRQNE